MSITLNQKLSSKLHLTYAQKSWQIHVMQFYEPYLILATIKIRKVKSCGIREEEALILTCPVAEIPIRSSLKFSSRSSNLFP